MLAGLFAAGIILLGLGYRVLVRQEAEILATRQRLERLRNELGPLREKARLTAADLAAAREQQSELPPLPPNTSADNVPAVKAWLARMKKLKAAFAAHPDQSVVALRLLSDSDWLRIAGQHDMDDPAQLRKAMAAARNAAEMTATTRLAAAQHKFRAEYPGQRPDSMAALAPFLADPADADLLAAFRLKGPLPTDPNPKMKNNWSVELGTPIDADNDQWYGTTSTGGLMLGAGALSWIPNVQPRLAQAREDFAAVHPDQPVPPNSTLLETFQPPVDPAIIDKVRREENSPTPENSWKQGRKTTRKL